MNCWLPDSPGLLLPRKITYILFLPSFRPFPSSYHSPPRRVTPVASWRSATPAVTGAATSLAASLVSCEGFNGMTFKG